MLSLFSGHTALLIGAVAGMLAGPLFALAKKPVTAFFEFLKERNDKRASKSFEGKLELLGEESVWNAFKDHQTAVIRTAQKFNVPTSFVVDGIKLLLETEAAVQPFAHATYLSGVPVVGVVGGSPMPTVEKKVDLSPPPDPGLLIPPPIGTAPGG